MTENERERIEANTKSIGEFLSMKGANRPCPRCGNNRFLLYESHSLMIIAFCSNCGLKFEHLPEILTDPTTTNTSNEDKEEE